MAYHFFVIGKTSGEERRTHNIDYSVGLGGRNRQDDVLLVQTYLRMVYIDNTNAKVADTCPPLPTVDIVVDGQCGSITHRYIQRFKDQMRAAGAQLYPDARMDPFRDNDPFSVAHNVKTEYALGFLLRMARHSDDRRFDALLEDERTHPTLKRALTQTRDDALQYS